jgi:hypothetical protein
MPATMTYTGTLAIEECCNCHITFAMPSDLQRRLREEGGDFHCPLGHSQHYTTTDIQRLTEKLAREERRRRNAETRARAAQDQAQAAEYRTRAYKGQVTRIRKRVGNGVCPCCNRTFADLGRHMAGQHPEFSEAAQ